MLVHDMININLNALPVVKLLPGEYVFNHNETFKEHDDVLAIDENDVLLGKLPLATISKDLPALKLRAQVKPIKNTVQAKANAVELNNYVNQPDPAVVYVVDIKQKLMGAIAFNHQMINILAKMKHFVPCPNIFEALNEAVCVIDLNGTVLYINHAYSNIVGVSGTELIGQPMEQIDPGTACLKVLQGHPPYINQKYFIEHAGVEVLANITPFYVAGEVAGVISMYRGLQETINLYQELQRTSDAKTQPTNSKQSQQNNHEDNQQDNAFEQIIGQNIYFRKTLELAANVSSTEATVMIRGDSGTGKEVVAEAIQKCSLRKDKPFIKINCAAIPENLLESELFGYEEGSFTGAKKGGKKGKFELAHQGTLFLDEVGDMSLTMQAKLLRVLQEKEIVRIGGHQPIPVDVRLISATNKDLETMVAKKQFRDDLYYRLNIIPVFLPPLNKRKNDIPLLVDYFLKVYGAQYGKEDLIVASEVLYLLNNHDWPGNIRELKNVIEHAVILCNKDIITVDNLPVVLKNQYQHGAPIKSWQPFKLEAEALPDQVERLEKEVILKALKKHKTKSDAIKALGISRRSFYLKLKKYAMYDEMHG